MGFMKSVLAPLLLCVSYATLGGAAEFPTRPVTMVVPLAPGGVADQVARLISAPLQAGLGQSVVVENRPGGGGGVGAAAVARGAPDGHTLLLALSPVIALPELDRVSGQKPSYELAELAPLARLTAEAFVVLVRPDSPWQTFADVVAEAKKRPGAVSFASSGSRGSIHLAMELVSRGTGATFLHVPYRGGGPAVTALLSKDVDFTMAAPSIAAQFVQSGQARAIGYSGLDKPKGFPNLTSFKEQGIDAEYLLWSGLYAPAATPPEIQEKIRAVVRRFMADPDFVRTADSAGLELKFLEGPALVEFQAKEAAEMAEVAKRLGKI